MNKSISCKKLKIAAILLLTGPLASGQVDNVDFLRAGAADGIKIIQAYISPWANAFGAGLNGSWYNTAKPHKLGGFDITAAFNIGMVPESAGTYDVGSLGLTTLSGSGTASTISGPDSPGPQMTKTVSGITLAQFNLPPGTGWRYIPVPTAQIGIGLPLGTELKVRYMPRLNIKDADVGLWGVGVMHSIMQYIPGNKILPVDVSVFGGYTKLQGNIPVSLQPDQAYIWHYTTYDPLTDFNDQKMSATVNALNIGVIGSVSIPVLTVYGGLGYSKTQTKVVLEGNYPTPVLVTGPAPYADYNDSGVLKGGTDIPSIDIKNFSGIRMNLGLRVKLAVLTIHADYTRSQYNVFSAGIGISFR